MPQLTNERTEGRKRERREVCTSHFPNTDEQLGMVMQAFNSNWRSTRPRMAT